MTRLKSSLLHTANWAAQQVNFQVNRSPTPEKYQINIAASELTLRDGERGLVISCPMEIKENSILLKSGSLDSKELRFSVLLWDRLDFPQNNLIDINLDSDALFLESTGILARTQVQLTGSMGQDAYLAAHLASYRELDRRNPGRWSLARGERSISFPDSDLEPNRGALFELHAALPVPDGSAPLAEVLEFKERRRSELLALRNHLERLYQGIAAAPDRDLALATELDGLDRALADHIKASREFKFPLRLSGFRAKLDWKSLGGGSAAGIAASQVGLPIAGALLVGLGATAAAALSVDVGLRGRAPSATPFEYISLFHQEFH